MTDTTISFFNTNLDRYEIKEKLGTGGMARVYHAYDANLKRPVAVKILHEHLSDDPTFAGRFEREAYIVASFNHPNIVQIYDFNTLERGDTGLAYMVMSFIPGKTLQSVIEDFTAADVRMDRAEIQRIIGDIANALDYAHMKGMVHRDVKPANILFDEENNAILTDFGIARLAENSNLTQEGLTVGTPAYMSPEQATGQQIDARSDIYALGVILFELLTGQPPFEDDGSISVLLKHVNEPPPSLTTHNIEDPYLDAVVRRSLAKDPVDRYQSAMEFLDDLNAAFTGKAPTNTRKAASGMQNTPFTIPVVPLAAEQTTAEPSESWVAAFQRSPLAIFVAGIAIIALVLFIGLFEQQSGSQAADIITDDTVSDPGVDSMTGDMPLFFNHTFAGDEDYRAMWPQGNSITGVEREILPDEGVYRIINERSGQAIATVFDDDYRYEDAVIMMTGTLEDTSTPVSGYGIIFRYVDDSNYNVFAVDGRGRFSIWTLENGTWTELRGAQEAWSLNEAVNPLGESNTLTLEIEGNQFRGMVNDELVLLLTDETFDSGGIGIYVAAPPGTGDSATIRVDSYNINEPFDGVNSMTGNEYLDMPQSGMTGDDDEADSP